MNLSAGARKILGLQDSLILDHRYRRNKTAAGYLASHQTAALSSAEKKEIDDYWEQFGVRFSNYVFFRMYYHVTGIKDPRFIPEPFAEHVLYPYYNDPVRAVAYVDKSKFPILMENMAFPKTIAYRINGHFHDAAGRYAGESISDELLSQMFQMIRRENSFDIIVKEAADTRCGLGVKKYTIASQEDLKTVLHAASSASEHFLVQFAVKQHPFFAQFNPDSVNIIRINSWRHGDQVEIFSSAIRFGIPGSYTDVAFRDGVEIVNCAGIQTKDGIVRENGVGLNGDRIALNLKSRAIPNWDKIKELIVRNHLEMDFFDYIAWDVTVDQDDHIICIEYNLRQPGSVVYQFANGPLAGEHTDAFLGFLKRDKERERLPISIRRR